MSRSGRSGCLTFAFGRYSLSFAPHLHEQVMEESALSLLRHLQQVTDFPSSPSTPATIIRGARGVRFETEGMPLHYPASVDRGIIDGFMIVAKVHL